jgi:hypothetical protein
MKHLLVGDVSVVPVQELLKGEEAQDTSKDRERGADVEAGLRLTDLGKDVEERVAEQGSCRERDQEAQPSSEQCLPAY